VPSGLTESPNGLLPAGIGELWAEVGDGMKG
jgi:hypothetical protein